MTSELDFRKNLAKVEEAAISCKSDGVRALFLPECFYSMGNGCEPTPYLVERTNEHYENIRNIASTHGVAILGGSAATRSDRGIVNRAYNFDEDGLDLGFYDKKNLFSCNLKGKVSLTESDIYTAGLESQIITFHDLKIGLGICFDVRFPKESWSYREKGANVLTYSSAFTIPTGKAHWHTLLRARAIESQCYVIACAQVGQHNERIRTYGHSLVISPWGEILVDAKKEEGLHFCTLDLDLVRQAREAIEINLN